MTRQPPRFAHALPGCAVIFMLFAAGLARTCSAQSAPIEDLAAFPRATLDITHADKKQPPHKDHFEIWIANTDAREEQGLMFVRDLPASQGMLFPMRPPHVANFWMKNTYIELDMIFIGSDARIAKIIEHVQPLKLDTQSSDRPVAAVLELKGGEASKRGLKVGDLVTWTPAQ
jgi:uncharacterized membrane protein (UPF0127 family)